MNYCSNQIISIVIWFGNQTENRLIISCIINLILELEKMATAKEKKEEVKASLNILRAELRKMHLGVTEELSLPEPDEVKKLMTQMEELLLVIEPKSSRKSKK